MKITNVNYAEIINRDILKMGISREQLFDAFDGLLSEKELFDFLDGKLHLPYEAIDCILCQLEDNKSKRVTRNDDELIASVKGRIIKKSKPGSEFILGRPYL